MFASIHPPYQGASALSEWEIVFSLSVFGINIWSSFINHSLKFSVLAVPPYITIFPESSLLYSNSIFKREQKVLSCIPINLPSITSGLNNDSLAQ